MQAKQGSNPISVQRSEPETRKGNTFNYSMVKAFIPNTMSLRLTARLFSRWPRDPPVWARCRSPDWSFSIRPCAIYMTTATSIKGWRQCSVRCPTYKKGCLELTKPFECFFVRAHWVLEEAMNPRTSLPLLWCAGFSQQFCLVFLDTFT